MSRTHDPKRERARYVEQRAEVEQEAGRLTAAAETLRRQILAKALQATPIHDQVRHDACSVRAGRAATVFAAKIERAFNYRVSVEGFEDFGHSIADFVDSSGVVDVDKLKTALSEGYAEMPELFAGGWREGDREPWLPSPNELQNGLPHGNPGSNANPWRTVSLR